MELKKALEQTKQEHNTEAAFIPTSEIGLLLVNNEACFEVIQVRSKDAPLSLPLPPEQFWDRRIYGENQWNDTRPEESQQWEAISADFSSVPEWARAVVRQTIFPPES